MQKLRRTRVIVATSETLSVWSARRTARKADEVERISVECPHCGEKALCVELQRSSDLSFHKILEEDDK